MPELPEVEIVRMGIEPILTENIILRLEVHNKQLRWPVDKKIFLLKNEKVISVQRRSKYLLLELKNKNGIIIHLGMSGCLRVMLYPQLPKKHDHIDIVINNGFMIRYTDPRRFGFFLWSDNIQKSKLLTYIGPEPLSDNFNKNWFYEKIYNKRTSIKSWLTDNKNVAGIGNIYANESLFIAGILPERIASSLNEKEVDILVQSIKKILLRSIQKGGTTLKNFLQTNGNTGNFIHELKVYGKNNKPCKICGTLIQKVKYKQRSTFFCSKCQK